jgi:hypothetical protein
MRHSRHRAEIRERRLLVFAAGKWSALADFEGIHH